MADKGRKEGRRFRPVDEKTVKERSQNTGGLFDQYTLTPFPRFKHKDGENTIRILGRTWDDTDKWGPNWGLDLILHNNVGPDKSVYLCQKVRGKRCVLCEMRSELAREGEDDAAEALKPSQRVLAWVIDRDDEKAGPLLYAMPKTKVETVIQLLSKDDKTGAVLQITDPDEGFDVTFTKTGAGLKTDYKGVRIAREASPIHDKQRLQDEWLDFTEDNPLPNTLHFFENDYIENVYMGKASKKGAEDEDEDSPFKDDDKPRTRRASKEEDPKPRGRKPAREEVKPDVEGEPEAEPQPEEGTRRRRDRSGDREREASNGKPGRRSAAVPKEPEDEDDDKDELMAAAEGLPDKEEEKPRRGRDREEKPARTRRGREEPEADPEEEDTDPDEPKKGRSRQASESLDRLKDRQRSGKSRRD